MNSSCIRVPSLSGFLPEIVKKYLERDPALEPFITGYSDLDGYREAANNFNEDLFQRRILSEVLEEQHLQKNIPDRIRDYLNSVRESGTLTVCTGHQLQTFGGPLYFFYKAATVVKLAEKLTVELGRKVIPVFWLASEDHDKEEVSSINIEGKKLTWDFPGEGPVGRMQLQDTGAFMEEIHSLVDGPFKEELFKKLKDVYQDGRNLSGATRDLIYAFLGDASPLVLDPDHPRLKEQFTEKMIEELSSDLSFRIVSRTNESIVAAGLLDNASQLQVKPRSTGLFWLGDGDRVRIEPTADGFRAGGKFWAPEEIRRAVKVNPEHFSPDVLNRPLYQQVILPNIGYVGGPAEIKYWFQLKALFRQHQVLFPILHLRNSFFIAEQEHNTLIEKSGVQLTDLGKLPVEIAKEKVGELPLSDGVKDSIRWIKEEYTRIGEEVDHTLIASAEGHVRRAEKTLLAFEKKVRNALVRQESARMGEYQKLYEFLFPKNVPQERELNFIPFYAKHGKDLFEKIYACADPMDPTAVIVWLD